MFARMTANGPLRTCDHRGAPGLFSLAFAWAIRPELGFDLPGTPFALAGLLLLGAMVIAGRAPLTAACHHRGRGRSQPQARLE